MNKEKILFGEVEEAYKKCQGKVFSSSRPQLKKGVKCPCMFIWVTCSHDPTQNHKLTDNIMRLFSDNYPFYFFVT